MEKFSKEHGFILLEAAVLSFLLLGLAGSMAYLRMSSESRLVCTARINACYIARYQLDRMIFLNEADGSREIEAGGFRFYVEAYKNNSNGKAKVKLKWKVNNKEYFLEQQRKYMTC